MVRWTHNQAARLQAANALLVGIESEEPVPQNSSTQHVPGSSAVGTGPRKNRKKPKGQKLDGFFGAPVPGHDVEHQAMTALASNRKSLADVVKHGGPHLPSMGAMAVLNVYDS
jgi:hypothetical protein